jgi:hypothetical protein
MIDSCLTQPTADLARKIYRTLCGDVCGYDPSTLASSILDPAIKDFALVSKSAALVRAASQCLGQVQLLQTRKRSLRRTGSHASLLRQIGHPPPLAVIKQHLLDGYSYPTAQSDPLRRPLLAMNHSVLTNGYRRLTVAEYELTIIEVVHTLLTQNIESTRSEVACDVGRRDTRRAMMHQGVAELLGPAMTHANWADR